MRLIQAVRFALIGSSLLLTISQSAAQTVTGSTVNNDSPLGINVTGISYWSTQWMLIDVMKQASNGSGLLWATGNDGTYHTQENELLDLDPNGWPRSLPAADDTTVDYRHVSTIVYGDNEHPPVGRYVVLYEGEGTLRYFGVQRIDAESSPGRDVLVLSEGGNLRIQINDTDPQNSGNYLRNIRVIVPGGICDSDPFSYAENTDACPDTFTPFEFLYDKQTFHPLFLSDMRQFGALRFMQLFNTNENGEVDWSTRPRYEAAHWASEGGAPIEMALEMANTIQAEPWLNVPARADDYYMQQMAQLVKAALDANLDLFVELGNEIWNNSYPYNLDATWMLEQGQATWPEANVSELEYRLNYFGKRSAEMCAIFKAAFGDEAERVKCVLGGQAGNSWVVEQALTCPLFANAEGGYACSRDMHAAAIAPYFAGYLNDDNYLPLWRNWIDGEADQGLNRLFEEMNRGLLYDLTFDPSQPIWMQAPRNGALAAAILNIQNNKQVADSHGIELVAYEGGQHLTFGGSSAGDRERINNELFLPANRDARMGDAFSQLFGGWKAAGGTTFMVFESTSAWSRFGAFPVKEFQLQPINETPKLAATLDFINTNPCWWNHCIRNTENKFPYPDGTVPYIPDYETGIGTETSTGAGSGTSTGIEPQIAITLSASVLPETWGVSLSWNESNNEVQYYQVFRDGEYLGFTNLGTTHYDNNWLSLGVEYSFQIIGVNAALESVVESNILLTLAGDSEAPDAPSNLTATNNGNGGYQLNWEASNDNSAIRHYQIYRNGEAYTHTSQTNFLDAWPPEGVVKYHVIAQDEYNNLSQASNTVTVPFTLSVVPTAETYGVRLSWSDVPNVMHYKIFRDGQNVTHKNADILTMQYDWLSNDTEYSFQIVAVDAAMNVLAETNTVSTMAGDYTAPTVPTSLEAIKDENYGYVLNWDAASDDTGVLYYRIIRNGEHYTHTSATRFHDKWPPKGAVTYQIIAEDAYHNKSGPSMTLTVQN